MMIEAGHLSQLMPTRTYARVVLHRVGELGVFMQGVGEIEKKRTYESLSDSMSELQKWQHIKLL